MDLPEARDAHLIHLRVTLGRAENTVGRKATTLRSFIAFLAGVGIADTGDVTAEAVERYVQARLNTDPALAHRAGQRRPLAETTANLHKIQLKGFLVWLREEGLLGADQAPERRLILISKPKAARPKKFVHREEIHHYAGLAREWHPRDEAWVYFQHYMGRRFSELSRMRVRDLDLTPRPGFPRGFFVYDDTKGRKYNVKGQIEPEFAPIAQAWLEEYAQLIGRKLRPDDYLIPKVLPAKGLVVKGLRRPLRVVPHEPTPYHTVKDLLKRAGMPASHALRRGEASHLTRTYGIRAAKTMLGHSDEKTTEAYIDLNREVEDLGAMFAKGAQAAPEAPEKGEAMVGVVDLTERRRRRLKPA